MSIFQFGVICKYDLCTTSFNSLLKLFNRTAQYDCACLAWHLEHHLPSYPQDTGAIVPSALLVSRFICFRVLHPHNLLPLNSSSFFKSSAFNGTSSGKLSSPASRSGPDRSLSLPPCFSFGRLITPVH